MKEDDQPRQSGISLNRRRVILSYLGAFALVAGGVGVRETLRNDPHPSAPPGGPRPTERKPGDGTGKASDPAP